MHTPQLFNFETAFSTVMVPSTNFYETLLPTEKPPQSQFQNTEAVTAATATTADTLSEINTHVLSESLTLDLNPAFRRSRATSKAFLASHFASGFEDVSSLLQVSLMLRSVRQAKPEPQCSERGLEGEC